LRQRKKEEAQRAFGQVLERVPNHRLVQAVVAAQSMSKLTAQSSSGPGAGFSVRTDGPFDEQFGAAIALDLLGQTAFAAQVIDGALAGAPPGNAGWLLPVEPLLNVSGNPGAWTAALARLQARAV
jgi:hypothetical protein